MAFINVRVDKYKDHWTCCFYFYNTAIQLVNRCCSVRRKEVCIWRWMNTGLWPRRVCLFSIENCRYELNKKLKNIFFQTKIMISQVALMLKPWKPCMFHTNNISLSKWPQFHNVFYNYCITGVIWYNTCYSVDKTPWSEWSFLRRPTMKKHVYSIIVEEQQPPPPKDIRQIQKHHFLVQI